MGGHGGLNILPQKRWNVYNRDNRLKVARDEAKHAAQEQELQAKHRAAEAEARRKLLLQRAKERRTEVMQNAGLAEAVETAEDQTVVIDNEQAEQLDRVDEQEAAKQRKQSVPSQQVHAPRSEQQQLQLKEEEEEEEEPPLEHINFWKDFEAKAEHPDRQKEKKEEKRKRGNPDTYTSDARFDESFQLGHGLSGPKPWYARAVDPCVQQQWEQVADQQQRTWQHQQLQCMLALPGHNSSKRQGSKRNRSSSPSDLRSSTSSAERRHKASKRKSSSSRHRSSKDRKHKKSHSKDKHKKRDKHQKGSSSSDPSADAEKALAAARLRAERLEREAAERHRSLVATGQMPAPTKRYNSSYGYADALKASAMGPTGVAAARGASAAAVTGLGQRFR